MDLDILKEAGLTDGEARVYAALLELGLSTTGPIIEKSKITRSFIYEILDKLMTKGLVSYITKDKTKYYQAAEPKKILQYIEERKEKLEESKNKVEKLLPQLMAKAQSAKESEVRVYQGFKGMMTAHEHTYEKLKKGDELFYFGGSVYQPKEHHLYWQRDHIRRGNAGIKCNMIMNHDTTREVLKNRNSYKLCDARPIKFEFNSPSFFLVYKDTVVINIPTGEKADDIIAIEIINQNAADSFKEFFNEFWKRTEKFK